MCYPTVCDVTFKNLKLSGFQINFKAASATICGKKRKIEPAGRLVLKTVRKMQRMDVLRQQTGGGTGFFKEPYESIIECKTAHISATTNRQKQQKVASYGGSAVQKSVKVF